MPEKEKFIVKQKNRFYCMKIWESRKDQRKLFRLTRDLLGTETFFSEDLWNIVMISDSRFSGEKLQVFHPAPDTDWDKGINFQVSKQVIWLESTAYLAAEEVHMSTSPSYTGHRKEVTGGRSDAIQPQTPLLTKSGMEKEDTSSYRPIFSLPFLN